jgi:hypothetical protein
MSSHNTLDTALTALDACQAALEKLDKLCCEPGRSPRMKALGATLDAARSGLERIGKDPAEAGTTLTALEDAGAQIGRLQVGCCAPSRLPLYATFLEGLTTAQRTINAELGRGH